MSERPTYDELWHWFEQSRPTIKRYTDEQIAAMDDETILEEYGKHFWAESLGLPNTDFMELWEAVTNRLALRDQQVTLAMCNEAVFDINPVDPDFGLIDKEQVERALAQLPWPHGSGEG